MGASAEAVRARRIAVFAGTSEGRALLSHLSACGVAATAFVATEYGASLIDELPHIETRSGRLDVHDMERELAGFDVVVDATHPYAAVVSANLRQATAALGIGYVRLLRASTLGEDRREAPEGLRVIEVGSTEEAARALAELDGRVLVTTGSKELGLYTCVEGFAERLVVRILPLVDGLERALGLGWPAKNVICMQGPFSRDLNVAMLRQVGASWLVTKDTGRAGGLPEKLAAAQEAGAGVIVIRRPEAHERGMALRDVCELLTGTGPADEVA